MIIKKLLALVLLCVASTGANASLIVDTGTPTGSSGLHLYQLQYSAAQFTLDQSFTLSSIQGYFSNQYGETGASVDISIHNNVAGTLGTSLFSSRVTMGMEKTLDWYGLSGLNWLLQAGTYWVSFVPQFENDSGSLFYGIMPGSAPVPLDSYMYGDRDGNWYAKSNFAAGIRIESAVLAVPESPELMMFLTGLLCLVTVRTASLRGK